ncbi:MAG: methyl-accepting chemotaxis protein [Pseudomonadota bacterium]
MTPVIIGYDEATMLKLGSLPLSRKLPATIAALCVAASLAVAFVSYLDFRRNILAQVENAFVVLTESRRDALQTWFETLAADVTGFGTDPSFVSAISAFRNSYGLMISPTDLQAAYVANNPNPIGQKDRLDQAPEQVPYNFQHGQFHPFFRQIKDTSGYYDLFLFNTDGDLVYSVFKGADFATNFINGPFRNSGLAQAFTAAVEGEPGQAYFADFQPYEPSGNAPAAFIATPIVDANQTTIGVAAIQVPATQINAIVNNPIGLGDSGKVYVLGPDVKTRTSSRFENGYAVLDDVSGVESAAAKALSATATLGLVGFDGVPVLTKGAELRVFDVPWRIVGEINLDEVNAPAFAVRNKMILLCLLVGIVSTALGWLSARAVVGPLSRFGAAMSAISRQTYDVTLAEAKRKDEIGDVSRTLLEFRDKLQASDAAAEERAALQADQARVVERLSIALSQLADGDLTHKISTPFSGEYDALRQNYNKTLDNLNETIGSLVNHAGVIRSRSDEMSASSDDLSRRTENQAATLEQTAAALDEMTASVKSNAASAREVNGVAEDARKDAAESEPVVKSAVTAMTEIESSSDQIGQIISVIDDIAFQTNLLALNAGVEAARAGEAGRGFAVVASEVRALAQRSSEAAQQIKSLISESSGQVTRGVALVGQAGEVLTKIASHINNISGLVGEIAASVEEQSTGLEEINIGVTQLDKVTQQNAAMVEEVTANSHALHGDAGELSELVTRFKLAQAQQELRPVPAPPSAMPAPAPQAAKTVTQMRGTQVVNGAADDVWQDF